MGHREQKRLHVHLFLRVPMIILALFNTGYDSGLDEGPVDCAMLHDEPRYCILA